MTNIKLPDFNEFGKIGGQSVTQQPIDWSQIGISAGNPGWGLTTPGLPGRTPISHGFPSINSSALVESFDPKRAGRAKTAHVVLVLDESSSMQSVWDSTISAVNESIDGQKADVAVSGIPTKMSIYKFNGSSVTKIVSAVDVREVKHLTRAEYRPHGNTNLLDAMGGVMMAVANDLKATPKTQRGSVMIITATDGEENASRTFDNAAVKGMVVKAEAKDWSFMFLGANIDAFSVGASLGMRGDNTLSYTTANMEDTMRGATRMANSMKSAVAMGMPVAEAYLSSSFTADERLSAVKKGDAS